MVDLSKLYNQDNFAKMFARFLKEHRAFVAYNRVMMSSFHDGGCHPENSLVGSFFVNSYENDYITHSKYISVLMKCHPRQRLIEEVISGSFMWSSTAEGQRFWQDLARKGKTMPMKEKISYQNFKNEF